MQATVERAKDEKEREKVAVTCTLYEARDEVAQELSLSDIIAFKASLDPSSCLLSILPEEDTDVTFTGTQRQRVVYCHTNYPNCQPHLMISLLSHVPRLSHKYSMMPVSRCCRFLTTLIAHYYQWH